MDRTTFIHGLLWWGTLLAIGFAVHQLTDAQYARDAFAVSATVKAQLTEILSKA